MSAPVTPAKGPAPAGTMNSSGLSLRAVHTSGLGVARSPASLLLKTLARQDKMTASPIARQISRASATPPSGDLFPRGIGLKQLLQHDTPRSVATAVTSTQSTPSRAVVHVNDLVAWRREDRDPEVADQDEVHDDAHLVSDSDRVGAGEPRVDPSYKAKLCRGHLVKRNCRYGAACRFAHSADEQRAPPESTWPISWSEAATKTRLCTDFAESGFCAFGRYCHWAHGEGELVAGAAPEKNEVEREEAAGPAERTAEPTPAKSTPAKSTPRGKKERRGKSRTGGGKRSANSGTADLYFSTLPSDHVVDHLVPSTSVLHDDSVDDMHVYRGAVFGEPDEEVHDDTLVPQASDAASTWDIYEAQSSDAAASWDIYDDAPAESNAEKTETNESNTENEATQTEPIADSAAETSELTTATTLSESTAADTITDAADDVSMLDATLSPDATVIDLRAKATDAQPKAPPSLPPPTLAVDELDTAAVLREVQGIVAELEADHSFAADAGAAGASADVGKGAMERTAPIGGADTDLTEDDLEIRLRFRHLTPDMVESMYSLLPLLVLLGLVLLLIALMPAIQLAADNGSFDRWVLDARRVARWVRRHTSF